MNKITDYDNPFSKVINKADKQVTTLLANTLETDRNEIRNEIDSTPSIDRNICTPANEYSKSSDSTNQNDL